MFSKGEIVKVKEDSELKNTYAFQGDDYFFVKEVNGAGDIQVVLLSYRSMPSGGYPFRDKDNFYSIAKISNKRRILIERGKFTRKKIPNDIMLMITNLRDRMIEVMEE